MHPNVHNSFIYNSQDTEEAQVPITRWIDKEDVIYRYRYRYRYETEYYSAIKKNEILPFATT